MENEIFNEYREIDLQIIKAIKDNKEDVKLLEKREEIIKKLFSSNLDKNQIKNIYIEKQLDILDKELEDTLKSKMSYVKEEIKKVVAKKQANLGYATANRGNNFFSTRI